MNREIRFNKNFGKAARLLLNVNTTRNMARDCGTAFQLISDKLTSTLNSLNSC